jgi:two-component system response regulator LytT
MINTLIIEDEKPALDHLLKIIRNSRYEMNIVGTINSVKKAVEWFRSHPAPDLLLLDIQLNDGLSFEIFNHVRLTCPIIFTTAYEEYALKAFKLNSIDYLLKPVSPEDFTHAMEQYLGNTHSRTHTATEIGHLDYRIMKVMHMLTSRYKSRFVVNVGAHIRSVEVEKISCFFSLEKDTYLVDDSGRTCDIGYSLDQLESLLDPSLFFRINRKYIINLNSIKDIINYSNRRLQLTLKHPVEDELIVSRTRVKEFREWLEQ